MIWIVVWIVLLVVVLSLGIPLLSLLAASVTMLVATVVPDSWTRCHNALFMVMKVFLCGAAPIVWLVDEMR